MTTYKRSAHGRPLDLPPAPHPTPSGDGELRGKIRLLTRYEISDEKVDHIMQLIAQECAARERAIRIDEVQKMPALVGPYKSERIARLTLPQKDQPS